MNETDRGVTHFTAAGPGVVARPARDGSEGDRAHSVVAVDDTLAGYFAAWNETNADARRRLLERSVSDDAELIDPTGRWAGVDGLSERIANYHAAAGTAVVPASGVDAHNDLERYAWKIVDPAGHDVMEGLDVAQRDVDGRLRRVLMFHGPLPAAD
jgi:hypothetical protein